MQEFLYGRRILPRLLRVGVVVVGVVVVVVLVFPFDVLCLPSPRWSEIVMFGCAVSPPSSFERRHSNVHPCISCRFVDESCLANQVFLKVQVSYGIRVDRVFCEAGRKFPDGGPPRYGEGKNSSAYRKARNIKMKIH